MNIDSLKNNQEWLPTIAQWYIDEWGNTDYVVSLQSETKKLESYLNENHVPLMLVAFNNDELLGTAQLKTYEMSIYPEYKYWIGGVFENDQYRGKGIAKAIVSSIIEKAKELSIDTLYLQTENLNGGLYKKLGWKPIEQTTYKGTDVLEMENQLRQKG